MKSDWIWMPHVGHFILGHQCRFHLNTYVNGYIVSTVGELWPDVEVRRIYLKTRRMWPQLDFNDEGMLFEKKSFTPEQIDQILDLKGDEFDRFYLKHFGYEQIGLGRLYESMVFIAKPQDEPEYSCCPWVMKCPEDVDFEGYNAPQDAYDGHIMLCEKWDAEVHGSKYTFPDD
jgi:hypothetical protein